MKRIPLLVTVTMMQLWALLCWAEHGGVVTGGSRAIAPIDEQKEQEALIAQAREMEEFREAAQAALKEVAAHGGGGGGGTGEVGEVTSSRSGTDTAPEVGNISR